MGGREGGGGGGGGRLTITWEGGAGSHVGEQDHSLQTVQCLRNLT